MACVPRDQRLRINTNGASGPRNRAGPALRGSAHLLGWKDKPFTRLLFVSNLVSMVSDHKSYGPSPTISWLKPHNEPSGD